MRSLLLNFIFVFALFCGGGFAHFANGEDAANASKPADSPGNISGQLKEIPFAQLSDNHLTALGQEALSLAPKSWKHAETKHFIYHFHRNDVATPVSVEAEYDYRIITLELGKKGAQWERKCNLFIFESPTQWKTFQKKAQLDPWTGGIQSQGELFLLRNAKYRWKGDTLAHEITHLVLYRFVGADIPLWLNEGFAEYAAINTYAMFWRQRGYDSKPRFSLVPAAQFIPLSSLTAMASYPKKTAKVRAFYLESQALVRFLISQNRPAFLQFMQLLAHGARFDSALEKTFGDTFANSEALETAFKKYGVKNAAADKN